LLGWGVEFSTVCASTLALTQTFIQGYMYGGTTMRSVLLNSGVNGATSTQCDIITVALHAAIAPFAVAHTKPVILGTNGSATVSFPAAVIGNSYYVVLKGRNLLETWSAAPVAFTASTAYHFGSSAQAFGANMGSVLGQAVIYNGDMDAMPFSDGELNLGDYLTWELANNNFVIGYNQADLNGDGEVNLSDYSIWELNSANFILSLKP
jgi:hypothetical protein